MVSAAGYRTIIRAPLQGVAAGTCSVRRRTFLSGYFFAGMAVLDSPPCKNWASHWNYMDRGREAGFFETGNLFFGSQLPVRWCNDCALGNSCSATPGDTKWICILSYTGDDAGNLHDIGVWCGTVAVMDTRKRCIRRAGSDGESNPGRTGDSTGGFS